MEKQEFQELNEEIKAAETEEKIAAEVTEPEAAESAAAGEQSEPTGEELAKAEIARLMQENSEKEDAYRRMLAEFDNYRKRSLKEKAMMHFDRAFAHLPEQKDGVITGMERVYKKWLDVLANLGVKEIEALGQEFNHDLHSAISHEENPEFGENIISEVYQKGYLYKDKVVRHSVVKVAN